MIADIKNSAAVRSDGQARGPGVVTDARTVAKDERDVRDYVLERMAVAEKHDRTFKEAAMRHWMAVNNVLPDSWPYLSRHFEPLTQNSCWDTIGGLMAPIFRKDEYADIQPVEPGDELAVAKMRQLFRFVLREKCHYPIAKFNQCQESAFFGNGVEKIVIMPKRVVDRTMQPVFINDPRFGSIPVGTQMVEQHRVDVWPVILPVSRFDCYPAPTGATIQAMPYFIERCIIPLKRVQANAQWAGYKNTDKLSGFFSASMKEGTALGDWSERHFDVYERLAAVGYDVRDGAAQAGRNAVEYCELLIYTEAPDEADGCGRVIVLGDREFVLKDGPNPYHHGLKPYADIKFSPRDPHTWQAKGIPELIEGVQDEANTRKSQIGDLIEMQRSPMTLVERSAGIEDLSELDHWPRAVIEMSGIDKVKWRDMPPISRDLWMSLQEAKTNVQRSPGGQVDYYRGVAGGRGDKGTETLGGLQQLLNQNELSRNFRWLLAERQGVTDGLNQILALIQQYMTDTQRVKITGDDDTFQEYGISDGVVEISPEDIACRWNAYAIGASRSMEAGAEGQSLIETLAVWREMPDVAPRIKQLEAAIELADSKGIRNPRRFLDSDEEFQQKMQEQAQQGDQQRQAFEMQKAMELIRGIDYRDAPPDIKSQLEQLAGLTPSQFHQIDPRVIQQIATLLQGALPQAGLRRTGRQQQPRMMEAANV